jgi:hypothetical protein
MMTKKISSYNDRGYFLVKNFLSKEFCDKAKAAIKQLKPKLTIPFSKEAWGFGDVRDIYPFNEIKNNVQLEDYVSKFIGSSSIKLSHFMLVNKAAWIGPDVEWHQEVFNMQTYAPGINPERNWKRFTQVFISLDKHDSKNGCLKVFEGSHKSGILDYEDIVNVNGSHKRRVTTVSLNKLIKNHEIIDIQMEQGDILFFNHLLVHGSPSNLSPHSRLSALLQYYDSNLEFDNKNFQKEINFRSNFIKKWFKSCLIKAGDYKYKLNDFRKD